MAKCPTDLKKELAKITLVLFVLSILASLVMAITPVAHASEAGLSLSPIRGPAGTPVSVIGTGFNSNREVTINFGTTEVARAFSGSMFGRIATVFMVPSVSPGTYTVNATDTGGNYATTTFTVTKNLQSSPGAFTAPTPVVTPTFPGSTAQPYPTYKPTKSPTTGGGGFWFPLTIIAIVAVAIAFIVPATFWYRRRGNQEGLLDEKPLLRRSEISATSKKPTVTSGYDQSGFHSQQLSKPTETTRSSPPSSHDQPPPFTKICPHCKRIVKDDYNLCPYCDKKLK